MQAKPIRIYDLDALFRKELDLEAFRYRQVAVFEGKTGVVVAEEEAVHKRVNVASDTIQVPANKPTPAGHLTIMPMAYVTLSVEEIKEAPQKEMLMSEFFSRRNYNPRCQTNWSILLSTLREIGFDYSELFPDRAPLQATINRAESLRLPSKTRGNIPPVPERE